MKKNAEISARITEIIEYLKVTANNFSKHLGYERAQTVYDILSGKSAPSYDFFNRFANSEYSAIISAEWLLSGNGEMLKSKPSYLKEKDIVKEERAQYNSNNLPLVEVEAVAGFGNADFSIQTSDIIERYTIPEFSKATFLIRVRGDSMSPHYNSGDMVACLILRESQFIQWNEVHVIATVEQGILIKRLKPGKDDRTLLAISDNQEYPPFEIPRNEIKGIALVLGGIRLE